MRLFLFLFSFIFCLINTFAQDVSMSLVKLGFENVIAFQKNDTIFMSIEDPVYRGTFRGAGVAINHLSKEFAEVNHFEVLMKEYDVEKVAIHASKRNEVWNVEVDYDSNIFYKNLNKSNSCSNKKRNSSTGKVNVTIYPVTSLVNNLTYKLFSYSFMLAPSVETSFWKGNHIVLQPIIPICNNYGEFDNNEINTHWQIGSVNIQQDLVDNSKWWSRASFGFFHYNHLGFNLDFGRHVTSCFDLGLKVNVTRWQDMSQGHLNVTENLLDYEKKYLLGAFLTSSYYEPVSSLELKMTLGRYLYGDFGCRVDAICHFGEYAIGLYGMYSGGEENGGFHFSIPMAGKQQKRMGYVSLRIPEYFDWEYKVVSNYEWSYNNCGIDVEPNPARNRSASYWQARYIQSYLSKYLNGIVD